MLSTINKSMIRFHQPAPTRQDDIIAVEEPLEIRIRFFEPHHHQEVEKTLSITMRTPGDDVNLALGFLYTEGLIHSYHDLQSIKHCGKMKNIIRVFLKSNVKLKWKSLERHFYTSSSCGVCGKTSIEALQVHNPIQAEQIRPLDISPVLLQSLPTQLQEFQANFQQTGGLHASALFDRRGNILKVCEDVGRHNALDKLIGHLFRKSFPRPLLDHGLLLSGRISFELIQKASMLGIPLVAALGAPSSLAIELAERMNISLIGFLKEDRYNQYTKTKEIIQ